MASFTKFTYSNGFYHITLGHYIYHMVPMIARHGLEYYDDNDAYSMFKLTGAFAVARTEKDKSIKLSENYYKNTSTVIKSSKELKKFILTHKPADVYQDHIQTQYVKTLKIWKESQTI